MAYSEEQWRDVRIMFESGVSLADIVAHKDVKIKSKGSISKKSNAEGWKVNERKHLVQKEVLATQELEAIKQKKETLTNPERTIHEALVSEQLQLTKFFRGANMLVANTVAAKVKREGQTASFKELASAAQALGRTQESVLGKSPELVINNTNAVQTNVAVTQTPEQVRAIKDMLESHL
jgi:hypothetical protein